MKREILFRGKRKDNGEWVYGDYHTYSEKGKTDYYVGFSGTDSDPCLVIPESVGQFTGLTDKNGVMIFEGDILKTETDKNMVVSWNKKFASFCIDRDGWAFSHWFGEACDPEYIEVIGNITDNPELLSV